MTIYIIQNNFYELFSSFTDRKLADEKCVYLNTLAPYVRYTVIELELVTDAFMELTLQPHKPKLFKDSL